MEVMYKNFIRESTCGEKLEKAERAGEELYNSECLLKY